MTDSDKPQPMGDQALPFSPAETTPKEPEPPPLAAYRERFRSQPSWAQKWLFEKPELIPLHLTWIFTAGLAVFALFAWRDAKEAAQRTQHQVQLLANQQRPWVYFEDATVTAWIVKNTKEGELVDFKMDYTVSNAGREPAEYFEFRTTIVVPDPDTNGWMDQSDFYKECGDAIGEYKSDQRYSTVFPNKKTVIVGLVPDIERGYERFLHRMGKGFYVVTCAFYTSPVDGSRHQTNTSFRIVPNKNSEANAPIAAGDLEAIESSRFRSDAN